MPCAVPGMALASTPTSPTPGWLDAVSDATLEIRIPDIGDAEDVVVIELCVAPGDRVEPDDALIVIESDKASMEVPAGVSGVVEALLVAIDDEVMEGQAIARIERAAGDSAA
ncbi:MAG: dihydrolipoamide acetyltransferase, partial [Gammaproteobacteria bacterium]|nr:dihydrolipoamide acetyltransferase [Gammaproteobacteria bacterium]